MAGNGAPAVVYGHGTDVFENSAEDVGAQLRRLHHVLPLACRRLLDEGVEVPAVPCDSSLKAASDARIAVLNSDAGGIAYAMTEGDCASCAPSGSLGWG